ncbi:MAG: ribosome silencing factor [Trichlorobacter sp.]|jgi:ribosome-associated protein|nr:ribosome silencing factor [Trichlorobacter sp.]
MNEHGAELPEKEPLEIVLDCAELAADKKAYDISILDISGISTIADFMLIVSGQSDKQNQAICEHIRKAMKKYGKVHEIEGETEGKWIVMDYGYLLVHIFHEEQRHRYDLDGLWEKAQRIELPLELKTAAVANKASFNI